MVLARVPLEVWHHDAVHAARPKNPPDLSQEPRHGTAVEVLEHMRVVDGVDAPFRSRDALLRSWTKTSSIPRKSRRRSPFSTSGAKRRPTGVRRSRAWMDRSMFVTIGLVLVPHPRLRMADMTVRV